MISLFINSLTSGGAEKVVLTLIDKFKDSGKPIELICIEKERFYKKPERCNLKYLTRSESLENSILKYPYLFVCAFRLKRHVKKNKIQLVQSHLLRASFVNVFARLMGSIHHAQVVVHSRINFEHKPWYIRVPAKWIYRQIFCRSDSIISISRVMKMELDTYLKLQSHPKHIVISNPHNLNEIQNLAIEEVDSFSFSKNKKYLISVARIVKGKRIEDLINAFKNVRNGFPDTELLIIGDGEARENLVDLADKLNLNEVIHFLGYQSNPFSLISKSDIFILTSEWEGLPNVIIESMICGTAVISTDCISGPREILSPNSDISFKLINEVEQGEFGLLFPVGNVEQLTQAIIRLLTDNDLRNHYVEKGFERARDFDATTISNLHFDFLKTFFRHPE